MILALNRLFSLATENNFTDDQEFSLTSYPFNSGKISSETVV